MNIDRGELVTLSLVDHLRQLREVFRDLWGALLHNQKVFITDFLEERLVDFQVFNQRDRLLDHFELGQRWQLLIGYPGLLRNEACVCRA